MAPIEYDISYTYDQGGNRLSKIEHHYEYETRYTYDVEVAGDADGYQHNNRLLYQETEDTSTENIIERRWYHYGSDGNLWRLVQDISGEGTNVSVWWFYYDTSGRLWLAVDGAGDYDAGTAELEDVSVGFAAEYRYDGGRQRYMWRLRDLNGTVPFEVLSNADWRDYFGNNIHRDYTVDLATGDVTNGWSYLAGVGFDDNSSHSPKYFSTDQIGTTRRIADSDGCEDEPPACSSNVTRRPIFTAFGEPVDNPLGNAERYGYAGAFGYERPGYGAGDPLALLGWLHVGERYYAPELGRFVQRDPIGIEGGLNVYAYCQGQPTDRVDPDGLYDYNGPPPIYPDSHEQQARDRLLITGGRGTTFLDRWGNRVSINRSNATLIGFGGTRIPKPMGGRIPGTPASTTSIWTKIPGIPGLAGQAIGRFFIPITICAGAIDTWVIIKSGFEAW